MVGLVESHTILHTILQFLRSCYNFKLFGEVVRIVILTTMSETIHVNPLITTITKNKIDSHFQYEIKHFH